MTTALTQKEFIQAARYIYKNNGQDAQKNLRKLFGHVRGIKLYGLCIMNEAFPHLKILDKLSNETLKLTKINYRDVQKVATNLAYVMGKGSHVYSGTSTWPTESMVCIIVGLIK